MDELVKLVSERAGLSEEQARAAVTTVVAFLKEKLPPPVAAQVEGIMAGSAPNLGELTKGLGGVFGR